MCTIVLIIIDELLGSVYNVFRLLIKTKPTTTKWNCNLAQFCLIFLISYDPKIYPSISMRMCDSCKLHFLTVKKAHLFVSVIPPYLQLNVLLRHRTSVRSDYILVAKGTERSLMLQSWRMGCTSKTSLRHLTMTSFWLSLSCFGLVGLPILPNANGTAVSYERPCSDRFSVHSATFSSTVVAFPRPSFCMIRLYNVHATRRPWKGCKSGQKCGDMNENMLKHGMSSMFLRPSKSKTLHY